MNNTISGRVWTFGSNIDTDIIIAARYLNSSDPKHLAKHIMEDVDNNFSSKISKGDIIIAGDNFGCGSSREHAPIALKAAGISAVIAPSFARIFYRNAFNMGLPIFELSEALNIKEGSQLEINMKDGEIFDKNSQKKYKFKPIPSFMQDLIDVGGLINYAKDHMNRVKE
jgi:3-isopropylmalate/(R)-2-methylmalate dehydratase small subunit